MTTGWLVVTAIVIAWILVAALIGVWIGRALRTADREETATHPRQSTHERGDDPDVDSAA